MYIRVGFWVEWLAHCLGMAISFASSSWHLWMFPRYREIDGPIFESQGKETCEIGILDLRKYLFRLVMQNRETRKTCYSRRHQCLKSRVNLLRFLSDKIFRRDPNGIAYPERGRFWHSYILFAAKYECPSSNLVATQLVLIQCGSSGQYTRLIA